MEPGSESKEAKCASACPLGAAYFHVHLRLKVLGERVDRIVFEHVRHAGRALGPATFSG